MKIIYSEKFYQQLQALFEISAYQMFEANQIQLHIFQNKKNQWHQDHLYFFYLSGDLDQNDSYQTLQDLFSKAEGHLEINAKLMGPLQFSTYMDYRICVGEHTYSLQKKDYRYVGEPLTPASLLTFFEDQGFKKSQLYKTFIVEKKETKNKILAQFKNESFASMKSQFQLKVFELEQWRQNKKSFYELTMELFSENPGFQPLSPQQFEMIINENYFQSVCFKTSLCLYHQDTLIGYSLNFIESDAENFSRKNLLIKTAGINKQHRLLGMTFLYLVSEIFQRAAEYDKIKFCLMKEGNFPSLLAKDFIDEILEYTMLEKS